MSESAIKRIFSIEECSLSKLSCLAEAIDLNISDLVALMEQKEVKTSTFSMAAEIFLAKNLDYFFFYRKLFNHKSLAKLLDEEKLNTRQVSKYLIKLEQLEIISRLANNQIKFHQKAYLKFIEKGPLKKAVYSKWLPNFYQNVIANLDHKDHFLHLINARASPASKNSFLNSYASLVETFLRQASLDLKLNPESVVPVGICLAEGPYRIGNTHRQPLLKK